jgi:hypothetical protein
VTHQRVRSAAKWSAVLAGIAGGAYASYVGATWFKYGHPQRGQDQEADRLLDLFMPTYDVADRHNVYVAAPAEVALSAAMEMDLESSAIVRGVFKGREWILRSKPDNVVRPRGLLARMTSLGWVVLAELPGREIVVGSVTIPWEPNPTFRAVPPDEFSAFSEPGFVKIVWTLRADSARDNESIFRTETRATATDREARKRFRRYWSFLSPGIIVIRRAMLPAVKIEAERRWRSQTCIAPNLMTTGG